MGFAIFMALAGAVAGYVFAPRLAGGVAPKSGAILGGIAGLIFGWFFKTFVWIGILLLLAAGAYHFYQRKRR